MRIEKRSLSEEKAKKNENERVSDLNLNTIEEPMEEQGHSSLSFDSSNDYSGLDQSYSPSEVPPTTPRRGSLGHSDISMDSSYSSVLDKSRSPYEFVSTPSRMGSAMYPPYEGCLLLLLILDRSWVLHTHFQWMDIFLIHLIKNLVSMLHPDLGLITNSPLINHQW